MFYCWIINFILPKNCINNTRFAGLEVSAIQSRINEFYQVLLDQIALSSVPWKITKLCIVFVCCNNIILQQTLPVCRFTHHGFHCSWKNCCGNCHASQCRSYADLFSLLLRCTGSQICPPVSLNIYLDIMQYKIYLSQFLQPTVLMFYLCGERVMYELVRA